MHPTFLETDYVFFLNSGIVVGAGVKCNLVGEIEQVGVSRIIRDKFEHVEFQKKNNVVTMASITISLKIENLTVILIIYEDVQSLLTYEIPPYLICLCSSIKGLEKAH